MNLYLILYIASIIICVLIGYKIEEIYKNTSSRFFLIANIFLSLWFSGYFLYFTNIGGEALLLFITKACFALSIGAVYSILFFILFFDEKKKYQSRYIIYALIFYTAVFIFYTTTDTIVSGLSFDQGVGVYRELPGKGIYIHVLMHVISLLGIIIVGIYRYTTLSGLTKVRFRNIVSASILLITVLLFLQLVLPIFNIWILEREIFLFFVLYIGYISFTIKRYTFDKVRYDSARIISWCISIVIATIGGTYLERIISTPAGLWHIDEEFRFTYLVIAILIFYASNKLISEKLFGRLLGDSFLIKMKNLEKKIRNSKTIEDLDTILKIGIREYLHIDYSEILYLPSKIRSSSPIVRYFEKQSRNHFFINDLVFIEKSKKNKHLIEFLYKIPEKAFLAFPIFGQKGKVIGCYTIGSKTFGDYYTEFEIEELKGLADGISRQIQYIETYNQLEDISRNLDRKVDEKTIAYNTLISRQREFITLLTHEIKTPVTTGILQLDNLFEDYKNNLIDFDTFINELYTLQENLILVKDMLSKLFSIEFIERKSDSILYPSITDILSCIREQIDIHKKAHSSIIFEENIASGKIFMNIDRTQFIQVINNLLGNAIKFASKKDPHIGIQVYRDESELFFAIEDNGGGIGGHDYQMIFEKYHSSHRSLGLGIGLYLCKKIIDLHGGTIHAMAGKKLGGMRVEIRVPIQENLTN